MGILYGNGKAVLRLHADIRTHPVCAVDIQRIAGTEMDKRNVLVALIGQSGDHRKVGVPLVHGNDMPALVDAVEALAKPDDGFLLKQRHLQAEAFLPANMHAGKRIFVHGENLPVPDRQHDAPVRAARDHGIPVSRRRTQHSAVLRDGKRIRRRGKKAAARHALQAESRFGKGKLQRGHRVSKIQHNPAVFRRDLPKLFIRRPIGGLVAQGPIGVVPLNIAGEPAQEPVQAGICFPGLTGRQQLVEHMALIPRLHVAHRAASGLVPEEIHGLLIEHVLQALGKRHVRRHIFLRRFRQGRQLRPEPLQLARLHAGDLRTARPASPGAGQRRVEFGPVHRAGVAAQIRLHECGRIVLEPIGQVDVQVQWRRAQDLSGRLLLAVHLKRKAAVFRESAHQRPRDLVRRAPETRPAVYHNRIRLRVDRPDIRLVADVPKRQVRLASAKRLVTADVRHAAFQNPLRFSVTSDRKYRKVPMAQRAGRHHKVVDVPAHLVHVLRRFPVQKQHVEKGVVPCSLCFGRRNRPRVPVGPVELVEQERAVPPRRAGSLVRYPRRFGAEIDCVHSESVLIHILITSIRFISERLPPGG